ncbi:MAG: hypothetical protein JW863_06450 [Chitinispirillaceae bacterium]|nr:hypothetical protein [Chitinispirillaceae bacterium]
MNSPYLLLYKWLMVIIRPLSLFFPKGLDIDEKRKRAMVIIGTLTGAPVLIFFSINDVIANDVAGFFFDTTLALLFLMFLIFSRSIRNGIWFYRILISGLITIIVYNFYAGPSGESSLVWINIFPLIVFFVLGLSEGTLWYLALTVTTSVFLFFPSYTGAYSYSEEMRSRHISAYLIISFISLCFEFLRGHFYTQLEAEREKLKEAMEKVRTLDGLVPICSMCKKIRDDKGYWNQLEQYLLEHTDARLSHGICDDCFAKYYPREFARRKTRTISINNVSEEKKN